MHSWQKAGQFLGPSQPKMNIYIKYIGIFSQNLGVMVTEPQLVFIPGRVGWEGKGGEGR